MRDVGPNVKFTGAIHPQSATTTVTGVVVDCTGYDRVCYVFHCGVIAATGTVTPKVQDSATSGGTYADITGAVFTVFGDADDNTLKVGEVKVNPAKPFQKVVATMGPAVASLVQCVALLYRTGQPRPVTVLGFNV